MYYARRTTCGSPNALRRPHFLDGCCLTVWSRESILQFGVERASCSGVELSYGEVELSYSLGSTERAFAISVRLSPHECWSRNSLSGERSKRIDLFHKSSSFKLRIE